MLRSRFVPVTAPTLAALAAKPPSASGLPSDVVCRTRLLLAMVADGTGRLVWAERGWRIEPDMRSLQALGCGANKPGDPLYQANEFVKMYEGLLARLKIKIEPNASAK